MKTLKRFGKRPLHTMRVIKRRHMSGVRRSMIKVKVALSQEKAETREMLHIYNLYIQGLASPEEMRTANRQFLDVLKGLGLGVFAVLPFSPITIPVLVKLGRSVGVDILPSAFVSDKHGTAIIEDINIVKNASESVSEQGLQIAASQQKDISKSNL